MVTTEDILEAYFDCRRNKRGTASAVIYEMEYETRLLSLVRRINDRTYAPGKSICFVVSRPRYREVFAASFEDRIVHHYIALRLEPLFEEVFSPRTYNCRKGKGQLYGINQLKNDIWECSNGYTRDCWLMKLDLKGFFMSIDKLMLAEMIDKFIVDRYHGEDKEDLRFLSNTVIMHSPEKNCERHSPIEMWNHLAKDKSLFTNGEGKGVAIGNLFAQLFANFLLNVLDWMVDGECKYHGRYVDDLYCISEDKNHLLALMPKIREFIINLGLRLNERKFYLQHYTKGIQFTGAIIKPFRTYVCNHTLSNFRDSIMKLNNAETVRNIRHCLSSINSYLGMMIHHNEFGNVIKMLRLIKPEMWKYVYAKKNYRILALKHRYTRKYELEQKILRNDW